MGCQSEVNIGDNLTFSICTHDPDTGVLTNADGNPTYRIYEDDTATAIANGTMATLDAGTTTGFYVKKIACSSPTYTAGKSYSIYIEATVDSEKGGICYGFKARDKDISVADIIAGIADGSYDLKEMMRIMFSVLSGTTTGGGTTSLTFKDPTGAKDRVTATVDASGNRTVITLDATDV
jgi:hypothetical protein